MNFNHCKLELHRLNILIELQIYKFILWRLPKYDIYIVTYVKLALYLNRYHSTKGFDLSIIRNCPVLSWPKVVVRYNLDFISTFGLLSLHTGNARYVAGVVVVPK